MWALPLQLPGSRAQAQQLPHPGLVAPWRAESSQIRGEPVSPALADAFSTTRLPGKTHCFLNIRVCAPYTFAVVQLLSHVLVFVTPWSVTHQAFLSMRFPRHEYWSGLPFFLQGIFLTQGVKSPALADGFFTAEPLGKPV